MFTLRTLLSVVLLSSAACANAAGETPSLREKNNAAITAGKNTSVNYTLHLNNAVNKNNAVDSVFVILDKFDHSGAGVVKKIFYPDANNQIVIEDLPAGKYYAEIFVLGIYKKHFSTIIYTEKSTKKNKVSLRLDYQEVYTPGNASIPAEDLSMFVFNK